MNAADAAFETRDFYLACFLRCAGYELVNLRDEGRRKVFVLSGSPYTARRCDCLLWRCDQRSAPGFRRDHKRHEGIAP
jgi:hypothetical protein